jgi:hypothetical protein
MGNKKSFSITTNQKGSGTSFSESIQDTRGARFAVFYPLL